MKNQKLKLYPDVGGVGKRTSSGIFLYDKNKGVQNPIFIKTATEKMLTKRFDIVKMPREEADNLVYVISDLHGYKIEKLLSFLEKVGFTDSDVLYVLGDVIDRGSDGVKLLRWMMSKRNIFLILGNHEQMLLDNKEIFQAERTLNTTDLTGNRLTSYCMWASNSGYVTIDALQALTQSQLKHLFEYLENTPLYREVEVNGNHFVLTHSGLGGFDANKELSEYSSVDLLWSRPNLNQRYYENGITVVFGHTPTIHYGNEYKGRLIKTETWIDIDVGTGIGLAPCLLRLDDLKAFYADWV